MQIRFFFISRVLDPDLVDLNPRDRNSECLQDRRGGEEEVTLRGQGQVRWKYLANLDYFMSKKP